MTPLLAQINDIARRREALLEKLLEPVRAAANQMKDAGMHRGADPLLEIIFQIDAASQEMQDLFRKDPHATAQAIIESMKRDKGGAS